MKNESTHITTAEQTPANEVVADTLKRILAPMVRICLANGVTFSTAEDILKQSFVQEAGALQPESPEHGRVSRISTATGISRREVARLIGPRQGRTPRPNLAAELFARWTTESRWRAADGAPSTLKRLGETPSFEALAQSITRDVHPRSLLEELTRLGIVSRNEEQDTVSLVRRDFVPLGDASEMLGFLADNVGDHLDAAVENILGDGTRHMEQAVFSDELSRESLSALMPMIAREWLALREAMVPRITALIDDDRREGRKQDRRIRIGLYSFTAEAPPADGNQPAQQSTPQPRNPS